MRDNLNVEEQRVVQENNTKLYIKMNQRLGIITSEMLNRLQSTTPINKFSDEKS
jgi:hypothetical protein